MHTLEPRGATSPAAAQAGGPSPSQRAAVIAHRVLPRDEQRAAERPADALDRALRDAAGRRAGAGLLQRVFLDKVDPPAAWATATASKWSVLSTSAQDRAVRAAADGLAAFARAATAKQALAALDRLDDAVDLWATTWVYGGAWNAAFAALATDVDALRAEPWDQAAKLDSIVRANPRWKEHADVVAQLRALHLKVSAPTSHVKLKEMYQQHRQEVMAQVGILRKQRPFESDFGEGHPMQADFERIGALLAAPAEVRALLEPLERDLAADDELSLTTALERYESMCGFPSLHVIPLGFLPAPVFLEMIGKGILFKDFGAGVAHGPLTHRLQWHAIMRTVTADFSVPVDTAGGWRHTPLQLYTALGKPPFDKGRLTGNALWGRLLDQSDTPPGTYSAPATMNADLMNNPDFRHPEALRYAAIKAGRWDEVTGFVKPPGSLPRIWATLVKRAAKLNVDYPRQRRGGLDEPTAEMMAQYTHRKTGGDEPRYEELAGGSVEFGGAKKWSMLIRTGERERYAQL